MPASKTQVDKLGSRLKEGSHTESDLRLLDEYRRSFAEACEAVVQTIRERGEFPTKRPEKTSGSIAEKLRRESIRLSQMQDIAGCRVVVKNILSQEQLVEILKEDFPGVSVIDRRENPSHGYRAIHIIVKKFGKLIEIQVRSELQHLWAEVSQKLSDVIDPGLKYGAGPVYWKNFLRESAVAIATYEATEKNYLKLNAKTKERMKSTHEMAEKTIQERLELHFRVPYRDPYDNAPQLRLETQKLLINLDHTGLLMTQELEKLKQELDYWKNVYTSLLNNATSELDELRR